LIKKALIPFISLLFLSYLSAQGFQFAQTVTVDGGQGNAYDLMFGFSTDATDGFDDGTDELAPPAPPPPAFDAALYTDQRYYTQIVAGLTEDVEVGHEWVIQLQYDTLSVGVDAPINLTWDNTGWSDLGTFVLQDAFGGALGIDVDMTTETSLTSTDPNINTLKLIVTPNGTDGPFLFTGENYETFPAEFSLHGNYPNPFNPVTTLRYSLSNRANVTVSVYNLMGQQIIDLVNRYHDAGFHQVTWRGKDNVGNTVPSGVYFYRVTTKDESLTGKMLLMK
jgi:hypothetical protein